MTQRSPTMQVRIEFAAQLRSAAGVSSLSVDIAEGETYADLARRISGRFNDAFRTMLIDEQGRPRPGILVFGGEDQAAWDNCVSNANVLFMSAMAGG